eukprot:1194933-Prorocentrum_minimum.AAC.1
MTDQSDAGLPTAGLDTGTAELTVKTLSSHLVTRELVSPTNSLRAPYVRAYCRVLTATPLPCSLSEGTGSSPTHT